jgi:hypothetical protein
MGANIPNAAPINPDFFSRFTSVAWFGWPVLVDANLVAAGDEETSSATVSTFFRFGTIR